MLLMRLISPELSFEQKKMIAINLTDAAAQVLEMDPHIAQGLVKNARDSIQFYFMPYQPNHVALGGRFISESDAAIYRVEIIAEPFAANIRNALTRKLMSVLPACLGLEERRSARVEILFLDCKTASADLAHALSSR
jgi:hypothetical protein